MKHWFDPVRAALATPDRPADLAYWEAALKQHLHEPDARQEAQELLAKVHAQILGGSSRLCWPGGSGTPQAGCVVESPLDGAAPPM